MVVDLAETYLSDASRLAADLRQHATAQDCPLLNRAAHTLKGTSRQMGANRLADLCAELEAMAGSGAGSDAGSRLLDRIESELTRVETELRSLLNLP